MPKTFSLRRLLLATMTFAVVFGFLASRTDRESSFAWVMVFVSSSMFAALALVIQLSDTRKVMRAVIGTAVGLFLGFLFIPRVSGAPTFHIFLEISILIPLAIIGVLLVGGISHMIKK